MLLFPESHYPLEQRKKSQTFYQESKIKDLLSYSVGEAVKSKPTQPINVKQDYEENQYLAQKNKQSYLLSNIFHDTKIQIRNDKQTLIYKETKLNQNHSEISSRTQTEPQVYQSVRGTLNQEFRKDDIKVENKQSQQSVLFSTLDKYYKDHKPQVKANFMSTDMNFLKHDSLRDKKVEQLERQLAQEYEKQQQQNKEVQKTYSSLHQSRKQSKQEAEINVKLNTIEIPKHQMTGYEIKLEQKGKGFLPSQFNSIIKHNGFCLKKLQQNCYTIQPVGVDSNIHSIAKYLKDYDNKALINKIPYQ